MMIRTHDIARNKSVCIGELKDGVFIKPVNRKKHYLRVAKGYAIQKDVVDKLIENDCKEIQFIENKSRVFTIDMKTFINHGMLFNAGHGLQIAIKEKYLKDKGND